MLVKLSDQTVSCLL